MQECVVTLSQMDPKLKLEPGLCDRYMIQQKGGSGTQFMEIDILNFGSLLATPDLVRFYLPVRLEQVCMFISAKWHDHRSF